MKMHSNVFVSQLLAGSSMNFTIGIDFNDTLQPAKFEISTGDGRKYAMKVTPVVGELVQAANTTEQHFKALQDKLTGMHENNGRVSTQASASAISQALLQAVNMKPVSTNDDSSLRFAGVTFSSKLPALVTVQLGEATAVITVSCEKMVFGSMLVKTTKETISNL